ncbi:hypothetical protein [Paraeggerthella sp.]|uniref:hypothetical protein n=1 Tax=Paraeggerthella sp. TaxID=2897350 RepID=UPI003AB5C177
MRILYGGRVLYDPDAGVELLDVELVRSLRSASELSFKMPATHECAGVIELESVEPEIEAWEGARCLMRGRAYSCEDVDDVGTVEYRCEGELAYLNDTSVRPYSTVAGEAPLLAPSDPYGYFEWLVDNHNAKVEPAKQFRVGVNQGHLLDDNEHILRSDSDYPSTGLVVREKLLESLGGFVRARYVGGARYVDYLADTDGAASQRIEFGANLLKFARTRDGSPICSAVIPLGSKPEGSEDRITIAPLGNGDADAYGRYEKRGDAVVSVELVSKVGYRERAVVWDDVTDTAHLVDRALSWLPGQANEIETLNVKAYDLSRIDPRVQPIDLGDYVRVTSAPHGYDSYMIVSRIVHRPTDWQGDEYVFGVEGDDIGDIVRKHAATLNAGINGAYEAADAVDKIAKDAQARADAAQGSADKAQTDADAAKLAADAAKAEADKAFADATQAAADAIAAKDKADQATAKAEAAQSAATEAKASAGTAMQNAAAAIATADAATAQAAGAKADAAQVRTDLAGQIKTVTDTMAADYTKKTDLTLTESRLMSEIERSAEGVASTVAQQYAKKTDLSTVQADLQTKITQNAEAITSTAASVTAVDAKANNAQSAADAAKTAAAKAQTDATAAAGNAAAAQTAADAAAANLATAEANLDAVSIRVGATEADVAAAELAVENAKAAADAAAASASTAKTSAATAQATADAAKSAAEKAQSAADALGARVASAETKIEQNAEAIVLRATKAEVDAAKGQAISAAATDAKTKADAALAGAKTYADAQIKVQADRITANVAVTDGLGARMTTVEQTASGLSVSLESVEATANSASATANAARTEAANAAKTATNYMQYTSAGLEVGNKSSGSWSGFRSRMATGAFEVIDAAGNVVARYGAKEIELGMGMLDAVIRMCGGKGAIAYYAGTDQLAVMAPGSIALAACRTLSDGTVQPYDSGVACNRSGVLLKGAVEASGSFSINGQGIADHVVAQGTSGIWRWRKWASGFAECWGATSFVASTATDNWHWLGYDTTVRGGHALPFAFKTIVDSTVTLVNGNYWAIVRNENQNNLSQAPQFWVVAPSAHQATVTVRYGIAGTWK